MDPFVKIIRPGTVNVGRRNVSLFIEIEWSGRRLSITGVEGPTAGGNAAGSCGQVADSLGRIETYACGWDFCMVCCFWILWKRWHLNDMRAGTPAQEEAIRAHRKRIDTAEGRRAFDDYRARCSYLESIGLLVDDGYIYGSSWLVEEVPADVLEWLAGLPDTDRQPAWV